MCVIIIKRAGQPLPSDNMLKLAHNHNPHGCGFASQNHCYKGMDFNRFMREIHKVGIEEACIIHFRIATHGSICQRNCHPFKAGDVYFAHNGVLGIQTYGDKTDSEIAFKDYIMPFIEKEGFFHHGVDDIIHDIIGTSKFALLKGNDLRLFGRFVEVGGYLCSNNYFVPYGYGERIGKLQVAS